MPLLFHHAHWDQTEESLCPSLGSRPTLAQGPSAHVPLLFGTTFHYLSVQPPRCHLQKTSQNIPFRLGLPPVDTGVPNSLLMLRNSLKDLAFEHRSGCCATEPGYAGDIGAIDIWLIDWLICKVQIVPLCCECPLISVPSLLRHPLHDKVNCWEIQERWQQAALSHSSVDIDTVCDICHVDDTRLHLSIQDLPFQKVACSSRRCPPTAFFSLSKRTLLRTFLERTAALW